ncbi:arginase [Nitrosomonas sp. Nm132]|jgi:arginase|uniref:arginase n=1 Tax=Nitrosomonas sp. Nm132 TaxID=1881053 RepID=UPI00088494D6|nr:arginase [Nitrosomonas sp. Nm132]SDI15391.1 arginase [Nitrosomonas sp. Nm132]
MARLIQTLGIASCLGGPVQACGHAAELLRDEFTRQPVPHAGLQLQWHMLYPEKKGSKEARLSRLYQKASEFTCYWTEARRPFLVIGGDHSCALGTWPGVLQGLPGGDELGLIWLDAHMDAHTFATTPSGNIHGMPVAALLGKADERLSAVYPTGRFIQPENLLLIGVRSYEPAEYALLKQANVKIVFADQISDLSQTLLAAIEQLSRTCGMIGISLDLDLIDPEDAPGVETPVPDGIKAAALLAALASAKRHAKFCGLEISEFNPESDRHAKTLHLMRAIVETFYAD